MRLTLAFLALVLSVSTAMATPSQDLARARELFRAGNFEAALEKFNRLLYPLPSIHNAVELTDAYVGLGVCRFETGDNEGASREFEKALQIDPNYQLDPLVITNKKAIELFDDTKTDIKIRGEREASRRREAEEKARLLKIKESLIGIRESNYALNFVPGAGQFQNGQPLKGSLFLGGQILLGGTSVAIWYYLVNRYGIRSTQVPLDEGPTVRRLQQVEIATGVAFFGLYIWGVIDAHRYYKRTVRTKIDESLLPPELRDIEPDKPPAKATKKTSLLERVFVTPLLTPDGAGIGIGWEMN